MEHDVEAADCPLGELLNYRMSFWTKFSIILLALIVFEIRVNMPDILRYLKIRSM
jgi:hypothetical protein